MSFRFPQSCKRRTDHVQSDEQREVDVEELTVPPRKIIPTVPSIIGVEGIHLSRIPALYTFSVSLRHVRIATNGEQGVKIFLFDLVRETAGLCYEYLSRTRTHAALILPCSLYAKHLEKNDSCLSVTCTEITAMARCEQDCYVVRTRFRSGRLQMRTLYVQLCFSRPSWNVEVSGNR